MSAEELLLQTVDPETSDTHRLRLRERLVEMHSGMVRETARRYAYSGEPLEDLLQAAYVGLMKAINGFDASLGHDFRGYAAVTMLGG
ncbi:sigma-70 family RNA polymerase sigma factor [Nonomuraea ceibae]|uniref:sigma-70 family RNA polymerase sigma factor n=1 Tax=Nonomuraea ceibae TaxID=1935170 RepID=UPI001FEA2279|nr:sigma factor [Nonomuraea ceibae]